MGDRDEEHRWELFQNLAQTGSRETRNQLAESYAPLAEFFANRYRDRTSDRDDLRQVAHLALLKAIDRFDHTLGVAFSTYAGRTIDGELKRYFRDRTWSVRIPRGLQEAALAVRNAADELMMELGGAPTVNQLAERTGYEPDLVLQALDVRTAAHAQSIDRPVGDSDDAEPLAATIGGIDQALERRDVTLTLSSLVETLPDRERAIVELRFFEELTQQQIADRLGLSQMHVSRLLRRALAQLRDNLD